MKETLGRQLLNVQPRNLTVKFVLPLQIADYMKDKVFIDFIYKGTYINGNYGPKSNFWR